MKYNVEPNDYQIRLESTANEVIENNKCATCFGRLAPSSGFAQKNHKVGQYSYKSVKSNPARGRESSDVIKKSTDASAEAQESRSFNNGFLFRRLKSIRIFFVKQTLVVLQVMRKLSFLHG